MIEVSERALEEFKKVIESQDKKGLGIKIKASMSQSCCSCGPSQTYEMDLVEKGDAGDEMLDKNGVRIFMDKASSELMTGFEVDFMDDAGFIVKDNAAPSCGCGGHGGGGHEHGHGGGSCCG